MKNLKLPKTDSIAKLAEFWDAHDLTDFEGQLQEVKGQVFRRRISGAALQLPLKPREAEALNRMAQLKGVSAQQLVKSWVLQKLARRNGLTRRTA